MKRIIPAIAAIAAITASMWTTSCSDEDPWAGYQEWYKANESFYAEQKALTTADGKPYYSILNPAWFPTAGVLIHYFNDTTKNAGNLKPLVNSTVDVKYKGWLYDGTPFDSSYTAKTEYGDSIYRMQPSSAITGWQVALTHMRVGDSVRVVIPWSVGYGTESTTSIPPFSNLVFDIKLVNIPYYSIGQ